MLEVIYVALGVYGISVLLADYEGPYNLIMHLRSKTNLLYCATCVSVWVAIPISLIASLSLVEYLAVLGINVLLTRNL